MGTGENVKLLLDQLFLPFFIWCDVLVESVFEKEMIASHWVTL